MLSVPIINRLSTAKTRPDYLRWFETVGADRVFLATEGTNADLETNHDAAIAQFAENIEYYRARGYETGIWINGLGHGGELSPEVYARTAHMTRIVDLDTGASVSDSFCPLDPGHRKNYTTNVRRRQLLDLAELEIPVDIPEPRLYVLCRRNEQKTVVGIWNFHVDMGLPQSGIRVAGVGEGSTIAPIGPTDVRLDGDTVTLAGEIPPFCFAGFAVKS